MDNPNEPRRRGRPRTLPLDPAERAAYRAEQGRALRARKMSLTIHRSLAARAVVVFPARTVSASVERALDVVLSADPQALHARLAASEAEVAELREKLAGLRGILCASG